MSEQTQAPQQPQAWGPMPQPEKPKKKHRFLKFLGITTVVIIAIAVFASVGDDGGETTTTTTDPGSSDTAKKDKAVPLNKVVGLGDPAKDGDFTFTVTKVAPGPKVIGTADFGAKPQGKFIFVYVTVVNHGTEAGTFFGEEQKLYDAKGREFSADTEAGIYLDDDQAFLEEINPGNKVDGIVVFDVPENVTAETLEFHDSLFSGGVTVSAK